MNKCDIIIDKMYNKKIVNIMIIIQPIIDILTFFMKEYAEIDITIGIVARTIFLIYSLFYIIFSEKISKNRPNLLYLVFLAIAFSANMIISVNKTYIIADIKNIIKIVYLPIMIIFFLMYNKKSKEKLSTNILLINGIIISCTVLISKLTSSQICTYGNSINCIMGYTGWFYSANEYGMILVMLFALALYEFYKSNFSIMSLISVIMLFYCALCLGTKASFVGVASILIMVLIFQTIRTIAFRSKNQLIAFTISLLFVIFTYILTPSLPVCYNNYDLFRSYNMYCKIPVDKLNFNKKGNDEEINKELEEIYKNSKENISEEEKTKIILNGRDRYLESKKDKIKETTISEKIFGMGYSGYGTDNNGKIIITERDYYDLIFEYGYFGFIIVLMPVIYCLFKIVIFMFKDVKRILYYKNIILFGIIIVLFGAHISGHTLFAPAVTTYIAYILGIFNEIEGDSKNEN